MRYYHFFVLDMLRKANLAVLSLVLLFGSKASYAAFDWSKSMTPEPCVGVADMGFLDEGDDKKEAPKNPVGNVILDSVRDDKDKDKVRYDDTLVYDDDISVDDTLVYEDFDTPRKGGEDKGSNFKRTPEDGPTVVLSLGTSCFTIGYLEYTGGFGPEDEHTASEGTEAPIMEPSVNLYPNPSAPGSTIYLDLEGFETGNIQVMDLSGRIISNMEINEERPTIDGLPSGTYLVTVASESAIKTVRVIVQ